MFTLITNCLRRIQGQYNQRQTSSSVHTDANVSKHSGFIPKPTERPMQAALKGTSAPLVEKLFQKIGCLIMLPYKIPCLVKFLGSIIGTLHA